MVDLKTFESEKSVFRDAIVALNRARISYVLGGAFAIYYHTGIWRDTKDMDVFLLPQDIGKALGALRHAGFTAAIEDEHWLGKALKDGYIIDLIFGEGNWTHPVDREWIDRSHPARLLEEPVHVAAIEELIWSKAYVASRDRFDGADIVHLIRASKGAIDWHHLLDRFGPHWQLLLAYVNLFLFVYPGDRRYVPAWVLHRLIDNLQDQMAEPVPREKLCRGTLLDRLSFLEDIDKLGYRDAREIYARERGFPADDVSAERQWARARIREMVDDHAA